MPVLKDYRLTKELALPNYPESKVVIYSGLLFKDAIGLDSEDEATATFKALPKLIKEWNFTNEAGDALPVTEESLDMLNLEDLQFILEEATKLAESVKKK